MSTTPKSKASRILQLLNYRLKITIEDGRTFIGQMLAFDKHMNLVLADCEEFRRIRPKARAPGAPVANERVEKRVLGLLILRGESIVSLSVEAPPPTSAAAEEAKRSAAAAAAAGAPGAARAAGRGMPIAAAPMVAAPAGLGGPVMGIGGPGAAAMQPQMGPGGPMPPFGRGMPPRPMPGGPPMMPMGMPGAPPMPPFGRGMPLPPQGFPPVSADSLLAPRWSLA
ncbi:Small nuclear ribonucleoprotein-associated protein B [Polyrhizophydium stewartii]|uniref:Sm protein B n=1 Tax=Polyrhizophydium stewartii TaxID=2732419 RepID=A0ABR4NDU6_9FUNG|nr:hypothetical protein HK105_005301 [Polyrhizophydium stewartii]